MLAGRRSSVVNTSDFTASLRLQHQLLTRSRAKVGRREGLPVALEILPVERGALEAIHMPLLKLTRRWPRRRGRRGPGHVASDQRHCAVGTRDTAASTRSPGATATPAAASSGSLHLGGRSRSIRRHGEVFRACGVAFFDPGRDGERHGLSVRRPPHASDGLDLVVVLNCQRALRGALRGREHAGARASTDQNEEHSFHGRDYRSVGPRVRRSVGSSCRRYSAAGA